MRIFQGFNLLNPRECPHHKLILVLEWLEVLYFLEEVEKTTSLKKDIQHQNNI